MHAAGLDLYAAIFEPVVIGANGHATLPIGIAIQIPVGKVLLICPRSGLSAKTRVTVDNWPGGIDADWRGEIEVILHATDQPFTVRPRDRVAQGVIMDAPQAAVVEVDALDDTARGTGASARRQWPRDHGIARRLRRRMTSASAPSGRS